MAKYLVFFWYVFLIPFFAFGSIEDKNVRTSLNDDLLLPYPTHLGHGPSHSHRYVRDCQPVAHGNITYETWSGPGLAGPAESKQFVSRIPATGEGSRWVSGHITVVTDPLRMLSVLEPGGRGGCEARRTAPVSQTAMARKCLYAQNAGFFNTNTRECLGNVVSDGTLARDSKGVQNAQFGIRRDGTLVFGYLSQEDVLNQDNPFVQLVSGVVWLLRNGSVYIQESQKAECDKTQETGSFSRFVNVISARTAVGHDREGRLVLLHTDGQTDERGMNLWEVANFLKKQGVVNAINLDGGGSSTFAVNGTLASYPSDPCGSMWRCPRRVSTVLCVHEPWCLPEDCGQHGTCQEGTCICQEGWGGPSCDTPACQIPNCSGHGVCTRDGCVCDAGWIGSNCSQACSLGFYGDGCLRECTCANGGSCDHVHGRCTCPDGFQGTLCDQECSIGFYGKRCQQVCPCQDMCPCDPVTGSCQSRFRAERNSSLYRAVLCLAAQMLETWQEKEAENKLSYPTLRIWVITCSVLGTLLLVSVICNLIQAVARSRGLPRCNNYSYVPLAVMNQGRSHKGRRVGPPPSAPGGGGTLGLDDSDSCGDS